MWAEDSDEPTEANVGRFIPTSQLVHWHNTMKLKFPDIYTADNKLFGNQKRMHGLGTKLKTFFDDDPDKPMNCEVVGSRWQVEFGDRQPMYVVLMGHELTQIAFTGAHEEGGWEAVGGGLMDLDSEDEEDGEEDSDEDEVAVAEVGRAGVGVGSSGGEGGNKDSGDRCSSPHCAKPGAQETSNVGDVIELPRGTFQGDSADAKLEINKNLTLGGEGMNGTVLKCHLTLKQGGGFNGGKILIRKLKVEGNVTVTDNTFDDVTFVSVEVKANPNLDAMSIDKCPGKLLLYCCEITGGRDGLSMSDRSTSARIEQTDISCASCRGIFANPDFDIKESAVYNCGGYGIKGRSGWTDLGGNELQPGPWSEYGA